MALTDFDGAKRWGVLNSGLHLRHCVAPSEKCHRSIFVMRRNRDRHRAVDRARSAVGLHLAIGDIDRRGILIAIAKAWIIGDCTFAKIAPGAQVFLPVQGVIQGCHHRHRG